MWLVIGLDAPAFAASGSEARNPSHPGICVKDARFARL